MKRNRKSLKKLKKSCALLAFAMTINCAFPANAAEEADASAEKVLDVSDIGGGMLTSVPLTIEDSQYIAVGTQLRIIDRKTGSETALVELSGNAVGGGRLTEGKGKLFIPLSDGRIEARNLGDLSKAFVTEKPEDGLCIQNQILYADEMIYAGFYPAGSDGTSGGAEGYFAAFPTEKGLETVAAEWKSSGEVYKGSVEMRADVLGDYVSFVGKDGTLVFADAKTGEIRDWKEDINGNIVSEVMESNGFLWFATDEGILYKVHIGEDGKIAEQSTVSLPDKGNTDLAILDGKVFVAGGSTGGYIAVYSEAEAALLQSAETERPAKIPTVVKDGDTYYVYFAQEEETANLYLAKLDAKNQLDLTAVYTSDKRKNGEDYITVGGDGMIYYGNTGSGIIAWIEKPSAPEPEEPSPEQPDPDKPEEEKPENPTPDTPEGEKPESPKPDNTGEQKPESPKPDNTGEQKPESPTPDNTGEQKPENPTPDNTGEQSPVSDNSGAGQPSSESSNASDTQGGGQQNVQHSGGQTSGTTSQLPQGSSAGNNVQPDASEGNVPEETDTKEQKTPQTILFDNISAAIKGGSKALVNHSRPEKIGKEILELLKANPEFELILEFPNYSLKIKGSDIVRTDVELETKLLEKGLTLSKEDAAKVGDYQALEFMLNKEMPGKVTISYRLPDKLKGGAELLLYNGSPLDKSTKIQIDKGKTELVFDKGGAYVLAEAKKEEKKTDDKTSGEDLKETTSKKPSASWKLPFKLPKFKNPMLVAAAAAVAALVALIVFVLMEMRVRRIREEKRRKSREEKNRRVPFDDFDEIDDQLKEELDTELAELEAEAALEREARNMDAYDQTADGVFNEVPYGTEMEILPEEEPAQGAAAFEEAEPEVLEELGGLEENRIMDEEERKRLAEEEAELIAEEEAEWNAIHEAQSQLTASDGAAQESDAEEKAEAEERKESEAGAESKETLESEKESVESEKETLGAEKEILESEEVKPNQKGSQKQTSRRKRRHRK